jgi:hypothetical protein
VGYWYLFTTFTTIEEVGLEDIDDGEKSTTGSVGGRVYTVGTGYTLRYGS